MTKNIGTFADLGLSSELVKALESFGYESPTAIQKEAIPLILRGADLLACAPTGTGKTAAFCLPLIDILSTTNAKARMPRVLILEPTRELALQVVENLKKYTAKRPLTYALIMGGESTVEQQKLLNRGVDVLIATPGRFLDLYEGGHILLTQTKFVVIDEADRMMDMGFIPDVRKIIKALPFARQTLLFSATMDKEVEKLSQEFLQNPKQVKVAPPSSTATTIEQYLVKVPHTARDKQAKLKRDCLRTLLKQENILSAIIFCNRKADVDILYKSFEKHRLKPEMIHGDLSQTQRQSALEKFKNKEVQFLIASDIAARGLHINDLPCVVNFDVPLHPEDYVHRIGRTGRAGQTGKAFTLITQKDTELLEKILQLIKKDIPYYAVECIVKTVPIKKEKKPTSPLKEFHQESREEQPVKGFGDCVPAFLLK